MTAPKPRTLIYSGPADFLQIDDVLIPHGVPTIVDAATAERVADNPEVSISLDTPPENAQEPITVPVVETGTTFEPAAGLDATNDQKEGDQ